MPKPKLYALAIYAMRSNPATGFIEYALNAGLTVELSQAAAESEAQQMAEAQWPRGRGFYSHSIAVGQVSTERLKELLEMVTSGVFDEDFPEEGTSKHPGGTHH